MEFEWDSQKASINSRKHGVTFVEAATVFDDPLGITVTDPDHSADEDRFILVGQSYQRRFLIISFIERGDRLRIISARELTRAERRAYENQR
ncbi:MAG TPA: BrnT family toxin [Chloroflexi bacterium]|nr:BrnT family toxin [Chloroflexota bacterium]